MRVLAIIVLLTACAHGEDTNAYLRKLISRGSNTLQVQEVSTKVEKKVEQVQSLATKQTFGSMVTPYKTITLDIYQETDVNIEQQQIIIAELLAKLQALQAAKVTVDPKFKVIVR